MKVAMSSIRMIGVLPNARRCSMNRLTYTVPEVAVLLGISRSKAYDLVAEGALPAVQLQGRRRLVPRWAVDELLRPPDHAVVSAPGIVETRR